MVAIKENAVEEKIVESLKAHRDKLRGHKIVLFGSRARGSANRLSDFDIAVDGAKPLDLTTFFEIEHSLHQLPTLYPVDWIDLNRASPKLREIARREGRVIYEA